MTQSIFGRYQSIRDALEYEYAATLRQSGERVTWNATVSVKKWPRRAAVRPSGTISGALAAGESLVRAAIVNFIERSLPARS
jgi:hypothetical protein